MSFTGILRNVHNSQSRYDLKTKQHLHDINETL